MAEKTPLQLVLMIKELERRIETLEQTARAVERWDLMTPEEQRAHIFNRIKNTTSPSQTHDPPADRDPG